MNKCFFYKQWPDEAIPTFYTSTAMAMPELPRWLPAKPAYGEGNSHAGGLTTPLPGKLYKSLPVGGSDISSQPSQIRSRTSVHSLKCLGPFLPQGPPAQSFFHPPT